MINKQVICFFALLVMFISCKKESGESDMDRFVNNLMDKMTIDEKIGQLNLVTPGGGIPTGAVVSKGVEESVRDGNVGGIFGVYGPKKVRQAQKIAVEKSRLGIPLIFGSDVIHGYKTTFPIPLGLSCSWDMHLIEKTARTAAEEATADGIFWNFSPMVDITRDPRWGRVAEGAGEDPFLGSHVAKAMVKGYQGKNLANEKTMMSTVKHMALYGAAEAGRDYNTVDMSRNRMLNDYLPPYKAAVEQGVGCVMSSFNDVEGIPASGNKWLLTDLLRNDWGFDGFVVSDYTSVNEMVNHGLGNLQQVSAMALTAGLDMDMVGEGFLKTLKRSLEQGKVDEEQINIACKRILEAKYKLGLFDDPYRYFDEERAENEILTESNRKIAREAAAKACVLLKNNDQLLPLKKSDKIALVGPLAHSRDNMLGTWAPTGDSKFAITVFEGMKNSAQNNGNIIYAKGANISDDKAFADKVNVFGTRIDIDDRNSDIMIKEAVNIAKQVEVIVAVIGEASEMSGESSSRADITIPESQRELLRELSKTGKKLVVVLMTGRPLVINEECELADAVLLTWHPGVEAGNAIADVIYGDYNPSGKLTMTFPREVGQIPIYYANRTTGRPQGDDDFVKFTSNYLDVQNSPLFPFGYGLSYTKFHYGDIIIDNDVIRPGEKIEAKISISNLGKYDGEEVVQMYISDEVASITRPVKLLKGFEKIFLKAGESKEISFTVSEEELMFYNYENKFVAEPGKFKLFIGSSSQKGEELEFRYVKN